VTARPSTRATSSPIAETPPASSTAGAPSATPWSAEWHAAFCAAFADVVIAQQLVRDIGRSLEADDRDNATGLAHELQTTVSDLGTTIAALPAWPGSTNVVTAVTAMLEQDGSLATQYLRYLEDKRSAALDRAHDVEGTLRTDAVPAVTVAVTALVTQGLTCPIRRSNSSHRDGAGQRNAHLPVHRYRGLDAPDPSAGRGLPALAG
jgi:hypothetical protein